MFSKKMRRLIPLALASALFVAPFGTAQAAPAGKGGAVKRVAATQGIPSLLAGFWNHLTSAWGKAGPSIDPSGGGGTGTGTGTGNNGTGNGATTPDGPADPNANG